MSQIYEMKLFDGVYDDGKHVYTDVELIKCSFVGCGLSITRVPADRTIVRNARIHNCDVRGCAINTAVIEDTVIDGLKTYNLLQCWGAVFKHVVFKGRIGRVMISPPYPRHGHS